MPYKVGDANPGGDTYGIQPLDSTSLGNPNMSWLSSQPSPKQAFDSYWRQASQFEAAGPTRSGAPGYRANLPTPGGGLSGSDFNALQLGPGGQDTIKGGLSYPNLATALDPQRYAAYTPAPPLAGGVKATPLGKPGQLTLDLIHPFTSFAQATGPFINPNAGAIAPFGTGSMFSKSTTGIDPMKFLAQRNVDILGNAPSRALDYLFAPFSIALKHLVGSGATPATNGEGLVKYAFQKDPTYWQWIAASDDNMLGRQAAAVAQSYAPGWQNQELQDQLIKQFKADQNIMLGLSSGDEAIDYRAKKRLEEIRKGGLPDYVTIPGQIEHFPSVFLPAIPIIGTQLGSAIDPVHADTEKAWAALTPQERGQLLQGAGLQQMVGSLIVTMPVFSGLGAVTAFGARAAEAGTFAGRIYKGYSTGLDVLTKMMFVGTGMALTNWAAEIAVPGYTDLIGREVDNAHPISDSVVGGAVNLLGYFASPAEVVGPYLRLAARPVRAAVGGGLKAIPIFKYGFGGVEMASHIAKGHSGPELTAEAFATDAKRVTLSEMHTMLRDDTVDMWKEAIAKGDPTGNFPPTVTTREGRIAYAQEKIDTLVSSLGNQVVGLVHIIEASKRPLGAFATEADRRTHEALGFIARAAEDRTALRFISQYGTSFWSQALERRGLRAESVEGYSGWLAQQAERQGWTFDAAYYRRAFRGGMGHQLEQWQTLARTMYQREFDHMNGTLQAAAEGSDEASRVMLARQTHLFRQDAVSLAELIRGREASADGTVPAVAADPGLARTEAWRLIHSTDEMSAWWAKEKPGKTGTKGIEDISLKRLVKHLDSLSPLLMARRERVAVGAATEAMPLNLLHGQLDAGGNWTLAFKPQYARAEGDALAAAGTETLDPTFVSYTHIGEGEFLQSPYLDYPMESADLIKIGGEGYIASRVDNITRSFRSWRIGQYQEASLHRMVTVYDGVTGAQASAFFGKVQDLAGEKIFGPKASGVHLSPQGAAGAFHEEVQKIGERIFGSGELRNLDTGIFERPKWDEIARRSFAQSARLNLLAGVTGRLKALPNGIGDQALMISDAYVPLLRFGMSPLFRIGEYVESKQLNVMRMALGNRDPLTRPLYVRGGITRERGLMRSELSADPMAGGLMPTTLVADTKTSAAGFLSPLGHGGRPHPVDAAAAEPPPPPGIDMPGGPEAMRDPAELRYDAATDALARAEYGLMNAESQSYTTAGTRESEAMTQRPSNTPEWAAYQAAVAEHTAATAGLNMHRTVAVNLDEMAGNARVNYVLETHAIQREVKWAQRTMQQELDALKAMGDQVPAHAPEEPGFARMYHGTGALFDAFERIHRDNVALYGPGTYLTDHPPVAVGYAGMDQGIVYGVNVDKGLRLLNLDGPTPPELMDHVRTQMESLADQAARYFPAEKQGAIREAVIKGDGPTALRLGNEPGSGFSGSPDEAAWFVSMATEQVGFVHALWMQLSRNEHGGQLSKIYAGMGREHTNLQMGDMYRRINDFFESAGYGGLEHEGGHIVGGHGLHRVNIIFDPANAKIVEFNSAERIAGEPTLDKRITDQHTEYLRQRGLVEEAAARLDDPAREQIAKNYRDMADAAAAAAAERARAAGPPPATELASIHAQPEHVESLIDAVIAGRPTPEMEGRIGAEARAASEARGGRPVPRPEPGLGSAEPMAISEEARQAYETLGRYAGVERRARAAADRRTADVTPLIERRVGARRAEGGTPPPAGPPTGTPAPSPAPGPIGPSTRRGLDAIWNKGKEIWSPIGMKEVASNDLSIYLFRTQIFPAAMKAAGGQAVQILRDLKVPERSWSDFLLEDRVRLQEVSDAGGAPHAWQRLFDHAEQFRGAAPESAAELDALYASPEWNVVSSLWLLAERAARDEAYGTHFFSKYRSAGARSINHPLLGIYPAAWSYKVAREWFKFLYDNHAFGEGTLRLGMAPAVAISHIEDEQNRIMAITGARMDDVLGFSAPLSAAVFMFNLVMPGDWSGLPFPMSRSIRLAMRGDIDPSSHAIENLVGHQGSGGLGVLRDLRLFSEAAGQVGALFNHVKSPGEVDFGKIGTVLGNDGLQPKPKNWGQVGNTP